MKERDASPGTKLHALIVSLALGETFATSLKRMRLQSEASWDQAAAGLQRALVESIRLGREQAADREAS